ncbi:hypothetical protein [Streptomyces sp. cg40]|uniref:hypothetical protein n=1 Tax=Streptomyces sp. cg40 TaxID=3419764 RepID=UPI003CFDE6CC
MLAEEHGDPAAAVSVYTEDIEHDAVGRPGGPAVGIAAAQERYEQLVQDISTEKSERTHTYYSENAATVEDLITCTVPGSRQDLP